jgi:hypothetical protein
MHARRLLTVGQAPSLFRCEPIGLATDAIWSICGFVRSSRRECGKPSYTILIDFESSLHLRSFERTAPPYALSITSQTSNTGSASAGWHVKA